MSRFNTPTMPVAQRPGDTTNYAGGEAFQQSPKLEFASILLTSFVKDQYYRDGDDTIARLRTLLDQVEPVFAAKAAVFARNEFGMRSISHVVAAEVAHRVKGEEWTKRFIHDAVYRVDDTTEILAYYLANYGKPVPNSLKKGLASALSKFDEYQLAKYRAEGKAVSLVDVVNLVHPSPSSKNALALKKLVDGELRSTGSTWEAKLSEAGKSENKEQAKTEAWRELLAERKIGYFALLRNLRNISEQAPELVPAAAEMLTTPKLVKESLVLPFRYLTALGEIQDRTLITALNQALDISLANVPTLPGKTLVVVDHSGSMGYHEPGNPRFIGDLFGAVVYKTNDADCMVFGSGAGYVTGLNPGDTTATVARGIDSVDYGHATNFPAIFDSASEKYERIVIFSDMQAWVGYHHPGSALAGYSKRMGANPFIYAFDLSGYGSSQFPEARVFQIAGFSEKIFDLMKVVEQDRDALVHRIEEVKL